MEVSVYSLWGNSLSVFEKNPLDLNAYSRMKHGSLSDLKKFSAEIADTIIDNFSSLPESVVLPVAYHSVRPACWFLATFVNEKLLRNGFNSKVIKIHKDSVTHIDYAGSSETDRIKEMDSIQFKVDEDLTNKHAILIDDVKITGLAEKTAVQALLKANPLSINTAYIATVDPVLGTDPSVEKRMNHYSIKSILDMVPEIKSNNFVLTIRFLKNILGSCPTVLEEFLSQVSDDFRQEIVSSAEQVGADFIAGYSIGWKLVHG